MTRRLIRRFARDTVTVRRYRGVSGRGEAIYDAPVEVSAHVDERARLIRDLSGREVVASTTVRMLPSTAPIPPASRLVVRGRDTTVIREVFFQTGATDAFREVLCE